MAAQVFKPHGCDLQAWDAGAFSRCIKGRRLIFFGDSTTRQQFQSLACLLGPVTAHQSGSNYWNESSITGAPTAACSAHKIYWCWETDAFLGAFWLPDSATYNAGAPRSVCRHLLSTC